MDTEVVKADGLSYSMRTLGIKSVPYIAQVNSQHAECHPGKRQHVPRFFVSDSLGGVQGYQLSIRQKIEHDPFTDFFVKLSRLKQVVIMKLKFILMHPVLRCFQGPILLPYNARLL